MHAEIDRLRARDLGLARGDLALPCAPAFVGRVVSTSNGVASAHWVKVNPHRTTLGAESEGSTGSADVDTSTTQLVYLVAGTAATGDDLVCHFVPWRWVGRKKSVATTTCHAIPFNVQACGANLAGAIVTLYSDSARTAQIGVSPATDASGNASVAWSVSGTPPTTAWYKVVGPAGSNLADLLGSLSVSCAGFPFTQNVTMTAASGYHCCLSGPCRTALPDTLFVTDANGTHTLTWTGTQWLDGTGYLLTGQTANAYPGCAGAIAGQTIRVKWFATCPQTGPTMTLTLSYTSCSSSGGGIADSSSPTYSTDPTVNKSMSCASIGFSAAYPGDFKDALGNPLSGSAELHPPAASIGSTITFSQ